jgi:folate-binding protein YgfZ
MPVARLDDRAVIEISGEEAERFLQNVITTDIASLAEGVARAGALLSPQGKILFDFLVSRSGDATFVLECAASPADDLTRRLMLYKVRAKVAIEKREQRLVAVRWRLGPAAPGPGWLADSRFPSPVWRRYDEPLPAADATAAEWHAFRIASGIAEGGLDFPPGDAFPHDVLLDQVGGVGFAKGCYVGQEVVSRMQHRGTARRRVLIVEAEADLPGAGAEVTAGGRAVGTLGSAAGRLGLAIVRIDRVKAALDSGTEILVGGVPATLSIPEWARFGFPQDAAEAGEA